MQDLKLEEIHELIEQEKDFLLYLYTPMCGTCQVAGKMTEVVSELFPKLIWGKCDLNYLPSFAKQWEIESVPCLLIFKNGKSIKKVYAFHSVPYLYDTIKQSVGP